MNLNELRAHLDELGIPHDQWAKTADNIQPGMVKRQQEVLVKLKELIQARIRADQDKVAELHVVLQRAKHGGGI